MLREFKGEDKLPGDVGVPEALLPVMGSSGAGWPFPVVSEWGKGLDLCFPESAQLLAAGRPSWERNFEWSSVLQLAEGFPWEPTAAWDGHTGPTHEVWSEHSRDHDPVPKNLKERKKQKQTKYVAPKSHQVGKSLYLQS